MNNDMMQYAASDSDRIPSQCMTKSSLALQELLGMACTTDLPMSPNEPLLLTLRLRRRLANTSACMPLASPFEGGSADMFVPATQPGVIKLATQAGNCLETPRYCARLNARVTIN